MPGAQNQMAWVEAEAGHTAPDGANALDQAAQQGARAFVLGVADHVAGGISSERPQGVYTCMRTSCSRMRALRANADAGNAWPPGPSTSSIIKLELHVDRIAAYAEDLGPEAVLAAIQDVLCKFAATSDEAVLVTLVACPAAGGRWRLFAHAMQAPALPLEVDIAAFTKRRTADGNRQGAAPLVKSIAWIRDRGPLEEAERGEGVAEIVMLDKDGDTVLEGLISNVFVVGKNGVVYTACRDVLCGSTRALVMDSCRALGIPLSLRSPRLSEVDTWAAVLLTSANKPAVAARAIRLPSETTPRVMPGHPVCAELCSRVRDAF